MQIAIISDIHDNVWKLAAALEGLQAADELICCGDLCSPFIVAQLATGFPGPIHLIFGNNDGDQFRITQVASRYDHVHLHGELFTGEIGGMRVAANHYPDIARAIAASGDFDLVCYGHNHAYQIETTGNTLAINPGALMGYDPLNGVDIPSTYVLYTAETGEAAGYRVADDEIRPYL